MVSAMASRARGRADLALGLGGGSSAMGNRIDGEVE